MDFGSTELNIGDTSGVSSCHGDISSQNISFQTSFPFGWKTLYVIWFCRAPSLTSPSNNALFLLCHLSFYLSSQSFPKNSPEAAHVHAENSPKQCTRKKITKPKKKGKRKSPITNRKRDANTQQNGKTSKTKHLH